MAEKGMRCMRRASKGTIANMEARGVQGKPPHSQCADFRAEGGNIRTKTGTCGG